MKPYTGKHCDECFSQLSHCRRHEEKHTIESSLKPEQNDQYLKLRINGQQPSIIQGPSTEENSGQIESLTCWICQEECTNETFISQHYDDHMR